MSTLLKALKQDPVEILSQDSSSALQLVKSYLDEVITHAKKDDISTDIDEITVDGLDANQVWWQAKMVLDRVQGDLMERIQELKIMTDSVDEAVPSPEGEDGSEYESEEEVSEGGEMLPPNFEETVSDNEAEELEESDAQYDSAEEELVENGSSEVEKEEPEIIGDANEEENSHEVLSGVNDDFFNLEEFNKQTLEPEGGRAEQEDDEEIDYFENVPSDDEEEAIYYEDFFDKPNTKKRTTGGDKNSLNTKKIDDLDEADYEAAVDSAKLDLFAEEGGDSEIDEDDKDVEGKLSTYERQQIDIQNQIEQLEKDAVAEKKWALKGEVGAQDRPADSLLTEEVDFDRTAKPVPVITSEVTESLEQLIRRRIQEYNFDDLQRRVVSDLNLKKMKPQFELSDQKSSKSLADIYEDDYKNVPQDVAVSEELKKSHDEISEMFSNLCYKLDALSSAHFIPKPAQKSLEIRVDSAAISMEDAQPLSMSSASALAPQEIYKVGKSNNTNEIRLKNGVTMSRDELTREDKNRLRRAAKRKRSKNAQPAATKKSKKENVIDTLAKNKNITVINQKGEMHDVRGRTKSTKGMDNSSTRVKL